MQLNSLYIKDYKLLKEFKIEFKKGISILIGINGSGKSSILETAAKIFSAAYLGEKIPFEFELSYNLAPKDSILTQVRAYAKKNEFIKLDVSIDRDDFSEGQKLSEIELDRPPQDLLKYLPSNIVIYYSGLSEIMKTISAPHDKLLSENYRKGIVAARPFFYYERALFNIILLSLLSYEYGDVPDFLFDKAKINGFQSIQIRLHKPWWAKPKEKVEHWWGAEGEVKIFLDFLESISGDLKSLENPPNNVKGNLILEGYPDYIIITILGEEKLFEIREHFIEEKALFRILNTLIIDDLLEDVQFSLIKEDNKTLTSFSVLSEGEQQAIAIKGLTELVTGENTLYLFDEPDTYLHPSWQRTFISGIERIQGNAQFVIATHSPQILSNFKNGEVHILEKGEVVKITPKYYGKDINTILFEMMGVTERPKEIQEELRKLFRLIDDEEFDSAKKQYNLLKELLGKDDPELVRAQTLMKLLND